MPRNARPASAKAPEEETEKDTAPATAPLGLGATGAGLLNPAQGSPGPGMLDEDGRKPTQPPAATTYPPVEPALTVKAVPPLPTAADAVFTDTEGSNEAPEPADFQTPEGFTQFVPLLKANSEEQTVTGVVLMPNEVDAQGDIYDANVVRKAAHQFLSGFGTKNNLGFMHKDMDPDFELYESFISPCTLSIDGKVVLEGAWVMTVKVNNAKVWAAVKAGKITGFSIGGVAKVRSLLTEDKKAA